jgi:hypothetical protein
MPGRMLMRTSLYGPRTLPQRGDPLPFVMETVQKGMFRRPNCPLRLSSPILLR